MHLAAKKVQSICANESWPMIHGPWSGITVDDPIVLKIDTNDTDTLHPEFALIIPIGSCHRHADCLVWDHIGTRFGPFWSLNRNPGHFRIKAFPPQNITVSFYIHAYADFTFEMSHVTKISKYSAKGNFTLDSHRLVLISSLYKAVDCKFRSFSQDEPFYLAFLLSLKISTFLSRLAKLSKMLPKVML